MSKDVKTKRRPSFRYPHYKACKAVVHHTDNVGAEERREEVKCHLKRGHAGQHLGVVTVFWGESEVGS